MTPTMKLEIVTMTPEWALQILTQQNTSNRHMRRSIVQRYAQSIRAGQWQLTQQGIAISSDGVLLDGQHRLAAIVEAEKPVQIALAIDCDPGIFSVLDTGRARLAADILQVKGATQATAAAAGLKLYLLYKRYPDNIWAESLRDHPTHTDIDELFVDRQHDIEFATGLAVSTYLKCRQVIKSSTVAFALLAIDAGYESAIIEKFCDNLGHGAGLSGFSPILRLRSGLTNGVLQTKTKTKSGRPTQVLLAALIKAFNYDNEGAEVKLFKLPQIPPMPTIAAQP